MNKKGVIISLLVLELIFLILTSFTELRANREIFVDDNSVRRIAAYKLASNFNDINTDYNYLLAYKADQSTLAAYRNFVTSNFNNYSNIDILLNGTQLTMTDSYFEMIKTITFNTT
jgi:hypothetical protein